MELYQLKLFVDLAETGNFTKVASENYVTQAAVTLQIRKLESELGVPLFHRTTRSVTLVEAGQKLLPYARAILQQTEEAKMAVRDTKEEITGLVRVAAVHSIGLYELPPYIKKFLQKYPAVNLDIQYRTAEEIYRLLHDGAVDVGLVAHPGEMPRIESLPFMKDSLAVFCPKDHPFAGKKSVAIAELQGQAFVQFGEESPTRKATDAMLAEHGLQVNVRMECDNIEILKQMIEVGFGVGLLPKNALTDSDRTAGLVAVPIKDVVIERPIGLLLLKNAPRFKAMRAFVTTLIGKGARADEASADDAESEDSSDET